jgi:CheY-like chemotaxis protein
MQYQRLQSQTDYSASRQTILVVDDHVDLRDAIAMLLEGEGYDVVDAADGHQALKFLRSGKNVAAIVLDLAMPVMDGWQFLAERKSDPVLGSIPTIVVTGVTDATKRQTELGNLPVFPKPFHFDELFAALRQALETGKQQKKPSVLGF